MLEKIYMSLFSSKLVVSKLLITVNSMHNLYAIFIRFIDICKQLADNLVNESGNFPRCGVVARFSDLEIIALSLASGAIGIDSNFFYFPSYRNIGWKTQVWAPVHNIMTDVNTCPHSVKLFVREWFNVWRMDVKNTLA